MKHIPVGQLVEIDGQYRGRVLSHCPNGCKSYHFPHYKIDVDGEECTVPAVRVNTPAVRTPKESQVHG